MLSKRVAASFAVAVTLSGLAVTGAVPVAAATPSWHVAYYNRTSPGYLTAISSSSARNTWVVGRNPDVARWNGNTWHVVTSPNFHTKNRVQYVAVRTTSVSDTW